MKIRTYSFISIVSLISIGMAGCSGGDEGSTVNSYDDTTTSSGSSQNSAKGGRGKSTENEPGGYLDDNNIEAPEGKLLMKFLAHGGSGSHCVLTDLKVIATDGQEVVKLLRNEWRSDSILVEDGPATTVGVKTRLVGGWDGYKAIVNADDTITVSGKFSNCDKSVNKDITFETVAKVGKERIELNGDKLKDGGLGDSAYKFIFKKVKVPKKKGGGSGSSK